MARPGARGFDKNSTTDEVLEGIDLTGRVAVVTGATGGLGEETSRALASHGAHVVMTGRDPEKSKAALERVRAASAGERVELEELELGSFASVRSFAERVLARHPAIHLLIQNAGVMACPRGATQEGHELQLGTNHFGHFLLGLLLAPALQAGAPARVVSVSSGAHRLADVDFDDPHFERRDYDKWQAYGQSKTANVLFAVELDRRLRDRGVRAFAVHPGVIMTELARHLQPEDIAELSSRAPAGQLEFKPVEAGAATAVWAATAPELEGEGGIYLEDCGFAEVDAEGAAGVSSYALDPGSAARLWQVSEDVVGERL